jgi:pimeloyl-ACP methyl ester carboxylesterase
MTMTLSLHEHPVALRRAAVGDVSVFYREAGDPDSPTLLLLHGFPSSSHMFRGLPPLLADRFHLVAPDLPGFGFTETPQGFSYTFENLAQVVEDFIDAIGIESYALYVFDYGAPVGFRLALRQPDRVTAIVSQNGNAYEEGLSQGWDPVRKYWQEPSTENRDALRALLSFETTRWQYVHGVSDETRVAPEAYWLDDALLSRPGHAEIQLDLMLDYATNVALYPKFQDYFRSRQPPLLAIWGKNDPFFLPAGALAFSRDNPNASAQLLDTGHFALETHAIEIATAIRAFLAPSHTQKDGARRSTINPTGK